MQGRNTLQAARAMIAAIALACGAQAQAAQQNTAPKIAVTDLAYAQRVAEYFVVGTYQRSSQISASGGHSGNYSHGAYGGAGAHSGSQSMQASGQASGAYVAGLHSYIEQRELGGYTNDIKGAILQGSFFRLVQGKGFDAGAPQPGKAEQVLNQVQGGKMATPRAQPQVNDVIARIKKGEFNGADYVLFSVVTSIDFTDALSPLQGSTSATLQYGLQLLADFSLINTKTYEIKAAFSAQGEGNDSKILSIRGDIAPPNRAKVIRETSLSLARDMYRQLAAQLGDTDAHLARGLRPPAPPAQGGQVLSPPVAQPQPPEQVLILK